MNDIDKVRQIVERAARDSVGNNALERAIVKEVYTFSENPTYRITFLFKKNNSNLDVGMARIRIKLAIQNELNKIGDKHDVDLYLLNERDWNSSHA